MITQTPKPNLLGGAVSPTQLVQNYQSQELGGLMNRQTGATARPMGTPEVAQGRQAPKMGGISSASGFQGVNQMVEAGNQAAQARLGIKRQQSVIAKRAAADQTFGGKQPYAYTGAKYAGRGKQYAQGQAMQQAGGSLGGRFGIKPEASNAFTAMENAFSKAFGSGISVQEGFRSFEKQKYLYDGYRAGRPGFNLAAKPGTSNHGTGIAVDLGGPFMNSNSAQHKWLQANGPKFGWHWVGRTFSQVEPWHWEYRP